MAYILQTINRFRLKREVVVNAGAGEGRIPVKGNNDCPIINMAAAAEHINDNENTKDACKLAEE